MCDGSFCYLKDVMVYGSGGKYIPCISGESVSEAEFYFGKESFSVNERSLKPWKGLLCDKAVTRSFPAF